MIRVWLAAFCLITWLSAIAYAQFNGFSGVFALNSMTFGVMPTLVPSGGSGYTVGDLITFDCPGGVYFPVNRPIAQVISVSSGSPTKVTLTNPGLATQIPSTGLAGQANGTCVFIQTATSGSGSGVTLSGSFGFTAANALSSTPVQIPPGTINMSTWPGVDPTGATDSTLGLTTALATGLNLFFPPGTYQWSNATISGSQTLTCSSINNTILSQNSTTGDFLTLSGSWIKISGCTFAPIVRTTGYQATFTSACFSCSISDFWMHHIYNSIQDNATNTLAVTHGLIGNMIGPLGIEFSGTSGAHANNLILNNVIINNAYPNTYGAVVTWATSTSFTANQIARVNGNIYQETAASCTSSNSGTGPSGYPNPGLTDPISIFTGTIIDGTCTWAFESNSFVGFRNDSWAFSATINDLSVINNYEAVAIADIANVAGSAPSYDHFLRLQGDHNYAATFDAQGGFDLSLIDPYACSSLTLNGIQFGGNFIGDGKVIGGRACDNWQDGIFLSVGSQFTISGVAAGSNSQSGSAAHNNIEVAAGIKQVTITNNMVGKDLGASNALAAYGVIVDTGSSDYYTVTGNICGGNVVTACVIDGGTGTHKSIPTSGNGANW